MKQKKAQTILKASELADMTFDQLIKGIIEMKSDIGMATDIEYLKSMSLQELKAQYNHYFRLFHGNTL